MGNSEADRTYPRMLNQRPNSVLLSILMVSLACEAIGTAKADAGKNPDQKAFLYLAHTTFGTKPGRHL
jgi:hypothetical protein